MADQTPAVTPDQYAGHPRLEALLAEHLVESRPYLGEGPPEHHFLRAAGWMRRAGLVDVRARTIGVGHLGPMDQATQDSMACVFNMFFGEAGGSLSREDRVLLERIIDPTSPTGLSLVMFLNGLGHLGGSAYYGAWLPETTAGHPCSLGSPEPPRRGWSLRLCPESHDRGRGPPSSR